MRNNFYWRSEHLLSTLDVFFAAGGHKEHQTRLRTSNLSSKVDSRVQHAKKAGRERHAISCTVDAGDGVVAFEFIKIYTALYIV
jgi:hypothetical protein